MKGLVKRIKIQATDRRKIFSKHRLDKGLIYSMYEALSKVSNKKENNPIGKRAKDMSRCKDAVNSRKDARHR